MANVLTGIRILCGLLILCFPVFSGRFYLFYLLGGFTDAIDGSVARKTGTASDFGSKFDTAADFLFTLAAAIKIISAMFFPAWLMVWTAVIALIKIGSHIACFIKYHALRTSHSLLNRICGGVTFAFPLLLGSNVIWQAKAAVLIAVCILASIAAVVEGITLLGSPIRFRRMGSFSRFVRNMKKQKRWQNTRKIWKKKPLPK